MTATQLYCDTLMLQKVHKENLKLIHMNWVV